MVCAYLCIHWIVNIIVAIETGKTNKMCVTTKIYHKQNMFQKLKRLYYVDLDEGYGPGINSHTITVPVTSDISKYIVCIECMEGSCGLYTIIKIIVFNGCLCMCVGSVQLWFH